MGRIAGTASIGVIRLEPPPSGPADLAERYGGVPPFRETRDYVRTVKALLERSKRSPRSQAFQWVGRQFADQCSRTTLLASRTSSPSGRSTGIVQVAPVPSS